MKLFIIGFLFALSIDSSYAQQQEGTGLRITKLSDNFFVYTTWKNYEGEPYPANGMYVITDAGAIMVDCPWDSTQWQPLLDSIKAKHGKQVVMVFATHFHADRTGGFDFYRQKKIATWSSAKTKSLCIARGEKQAANVFNKDTAFNVGGKSFEIYYPGKGHSSDNIVLWFGKEKILYGGCMIKSTETNSLGNLGDADLKVWPVSMKKLIKKYPVRSYVIPGHQSWQDDKSPEHTLKLLSQNKSSK